MEYYAYRGIDPFKITNLKNNQNISFISKINCPPIKKYT